RRRYFDGTLHGFPSIEGVAFEERRSGFLKNSRLRSKTPLFGATRNAASAPRKQASVAQKQARIAPCASTAFEGQDLVLDPSRPSGSSAGAHPRSPRTTQTPFD